MRQRFLAEPESHLDEHEVLEILLYYVYSQCDTNEYAHKLLERFGGIRYIFNADIEDIAEVAGDSAAVFLRLISDVMRKVYGGCYYEAEEYNRLNYLKNINSSLFDEVTTENCILLMFNYEDSIVWKYPFHARDLIEGRITLKDLAKMLLFTEYHMICLAIDHRGGIPVPKDEDHEVNYTLAGILKSLDLRYVDCVICTDDMNYSLRKYGAFSFD